MGLNMLNPNEVLSAEDEQEISDRIRSALEDPQAMLKYNEIDDAAVLVLMFSKDKEKSIVEIELRSLTRDELIHILPPIANDLAAFPHTRKEGKNVVLYLDDEKNQARLMFTEWPIVVQKGTES